MRNGKKKSVVGDPINFRGMAHAPTNEARVVAPFSMVARDLGCYIQEIGTDFPDCIVRRGSVGVRLRSFHFKSANSKSDPDARACAALASRKEPINRLDELRVHDATCLCGDALKGRNSAAGRQGCPAFGSLPLAARCIVSLVAGFVHCSPPVATCNPPGPEPPRQKGEGGRFRRGTGRE